MTLQHFGPWPLFRFLNPTRSRLDSLDGDQPVVRPLPKHRTTQTQNKRTQTSMPQVRFEPTNTVFERAKKVHALDRAATVIGIKWLKILPKIDLYADPKSYMQSHNYEKIKWTYTKWLLSLFTSSNDCKNIY
jgi:hypothetical protein